MFAKPFFRKTVFEILPIQPINFQQPSVTPCLNASNRFECLLPLAFMFQSIDRVKMTSHIYGRNTIAILYVNTVVLCVVKW